MKKIFSMFLLAAASPAYVAHAAPLLTLSPASGGLSGSPGATVGWGFTLTNTTDFAVVTGTSFVPSPLSSVGTYEDYLGPRGTPVIVGPGPLDSPVYSEPFNSGTQTG